MTHLRIVRPLPLVALIVLAAPRPAVAQRNWVQSTGTPQPTAQLTFDMVYDVSRDRTVLFGGRAPGPNAIIFDETWEFDGTNWMQRFPQHSPSPRANFRLAMAPGGGVLLYGGGAVGPLDETWTWDGTDWTQHTPPVSPPPMAGFAMWYDFARNRTVAFGASSQTWSWDGISWTQIITQNSPPSRYSTHAAYDISRDRAVLFGGGVGPGPVNDTWEFDGVEWQQMTPPTVPGPRWGMKLAYDLWSRRIVMHGGNASGWFLAETWEWDGFDWHLITTATAASARDNHSIAFDWVREQTVIYGGYPNDDCWIYVQQSAGRFTPLGYGCPGSAGVPTLTAAPNTVPIQGQTFTVQLGSLPTQAAMAIGVIGFSELAGVSLSGVGLTGCRQFAAADIAIWTPAASGAATLPLVLPANPALQGTSFYLQAVVPDPGVNPIGLTVSNAADCQIG